MVKTDHVIPGEKGMMDTINATRKKRLPVIAQKLPTLAPMKEDAESTNETQPANRFAHWSLFDCHRFFDETPNSYWISRLVHQANQRSNCISGLSEFIMAYGAYDFRADLKCREIAGRREAAIMRPL